jgi:hypothetical protein
MQNPACNEGCETDRDIIPIKRVGRSRGRTSLGYCDCRCKVVACNCRLTGIHFILGSPSAGGALVVVMPRWRNIPVFDPRIDPGIRRIEEEGKTTKDVNA